MRSFAVRAVPFAMPLAVLVALLSATLVPELAEAQRRRTRAPARGTLVIHSSQEGAEVLVDEEVVGTTPLAPVTLAAGSHTLRVRLPGHTEFTDVVRVQPGQAVEVSVDLLPLSQVLSVVTEPPGAHVYVDGDFMGDTPVEFDLLEGPHSVRVTQRGYRDAIREVIARAGTREELRRARAALPAAAVSDPPPPPDGFEGPGPWIAIGGGAVAIAVAIAVVAVVASDSSQSELDGFCAQAGGCFRVETRW